MGAYYFF